MSVNELIKFKESILIELKQCGIQGFLSPDKGRKFIEDIKLERIKYDEEKSNLLLDK